MTANCPFPRRLLILCLYAVTSVACSQEAGVEQTPAVAAAPAAEAEPSAEIELSTGEKPGDDSRPNILLIVADDIGYSDIGAFGSEISTPNLDALANQGILLTQFHTFPNCGPTRGALMTGVNPHRAGMASNHGGAAPNQQGMPGYEGHLREDVVSIAQLLNKARYRTYMTGKWHLGEGDNNPAARGFDRSFALMNGAASHWADQAPIIPGSATHYTRDGQPVSELPADFYSTRFYTDELISYIDSDDSAPFFGFLSYTAAHNSLHAPREHIEKYQGRFDQGWDVLATQRLARMQALGLMGDHQQVKPRPDWIKAWQALSPEQQAVRARDMEIYAAMIDYMDASIGRLLGHLRESGRYNNTLIVFISDNGPSRTSIMDYLAMGGESEAFFNKFDNSLDNRGLPGSSTDIGPGWAYAASTPLRLFKGYVSQGGIQVPAIVKPAGEVAAAGRESDQLAHVMDLMPTFLEVAGAQYPMRHHDRTLVPLQGKSLLPVLNGAPALTETRTIVWSAYGMDAYRAGNCKVLRLPVPYGNGEWQLYDLANDPGELNDLAAQHPDRAASLAAAWDEYAQANGVIMPDTPMFYSVPVTGQKF